MTNRGIDTRSGLDIGETQRTIVGPSFISYVHPGSWQQRPLSLAVYRQEVSRLRARANTQGFFFQRQDDPTDRRELPFQVDRQIDVVSYGTSIGVSLDTAGSLAIGGGVQASNLAMFSLLRGYEYPAPGGVRDLYAAADYRELLYEGHQIVDDWSMSFNAGVMWKPADAVRFGASYRRGATFTFDAGFRYPERLGREPGTNRDYQGKFRVPDTASVAVAVNPVRALTLAAEYARVRYSQLVRFVRDTVIFSSADPLQFEIPDSNEWHFGAEYLFVAPRLAPRVRIGLWRDPNHALTYGGTDELWQVLPPGSSLTHLSFGGGIELNQDIRLDAGADISKRPVVIAVSAILLF